MNGRLVAGGIATVIAIATPMVVIFEGMVLPVYLDPVGIPTECVGHTGSGVVMGNVSTRERCLQLLSSDLVIAYTGVESCVFTPLHSWEAAALVSFTFNVGAGALCRSTMVKLINAGAPASEWCPQMERFVYAKGIKWPGLVTRRKKERAICEFGPFYNVIGGSNSTAPDAIN